MKLWLLERPNADWDQYCVFVVRAETAEQARALTNEACHSGDPWPRSKTVTCVEITAAGEPGIVLSDFASG